MMTRLKAMTQYPHSVMSMPSKCAPLTSGFRWKPTTVKWPMW